MNIQGENKTQNRVLSLLPLWIVIGIFMIGPLLVMAAVSLMESNVYGGVHLKFSLSGYRQILFDTMDLLKGQHTNNRYVTMSPKTEMAMKFHLSNGAVLLRENEETNNFEYK